MTDTSENPGWVKWLGWHYRLCRWALGLIFIYAGCVKLQAPMTFAAQIEAWGILPDGLLVPAAVGLPLLEVAAGFGVLFDVRGSLAVVAGLLAVFIAVLGWGIWMGLDVDCGCFGPGDVESAAFHGLRVSLWRDLAMMAGVVFLYAWRRCGARRPASGVVLADHLFSKRRKENASS